MAKHVETESYDILIKAVSDFQENLQRNSALLRNAANVCDQAMGSDAIVKKHINRLNDALDLLLKTSQMSADMADSLKRDKERALLIFEEA